MKINDKFHLHRVVSVWTFIVFLRFFYHLFTSEFQEWLNFNLLDEQTDQYGLRKFEFRACFLFSHVNFFVVMNLSRLLFYFSRKVNLS